MTQRNYLQHGDRHRATGTDPIPGLGAAIKWAEIDIASLGVTVPAYSGGSPGVTNIDMDHSFLYTNDSSIFQITTVVLSATTYYGIGVLVPGHYLCKAYMEIDNGDTTGTIGVTWSATPGHQALLGSSGFNFKPIGTPTHGTNQTMFYMETLVTCASITYPTDPFIVQVGNNSGAAASVATVNMIVIQLDTDETII